MAAAIASEAPRAQEATSAPSARRRTSRRSEATTGGSRRRPRDARLGGEALITDLSEMVDRLIKENRQLKRALAKAEKTSGGADLGQATKTLSGLQRRVSRALTSTASPRRRGAAATAAAAPRPRRRVTDPEVLERRRQALVKARAARQAKRQAQGA
jgi:hypothetical protein